MEQKRCPNCGYMNHPDMEMCAKCGQNLKGLLSSLNLSGDAMEDNAINMLIHGNTDITKEKLLKMVDDKAMSENITPELKQKIKDAISRSDFTGYKNPGYEKWERQNIQKRRIYLIIAVILGMMITATAIAFLLMRSVSTTP